MKQNALLAEGPTTQVFIVI